MRTHAQPVKKSCRITVPTILWLLLAVLLALVPNTVFQTIPREVSRWTELLDTYPDPMMKQWIEDGLTDGFPIYMTEGAPDANNRNLPMDASQLQGVLEWLIENVRQKKLLGPYFSYKDLPFDLFTSPLGCVPKKVNIISGLVEKWRVIHHLSAPRLGISVNSLIHESVQTVKYISFKQIVEFFVALGVGAWIWKYDLANAYRQFNVRQEDVRFLGAKLAGLLFVDTTLPMGLRSACTIFSLIGDAILYCVRELAIKLVMERQQCTRKVALTQHVFYISKAVACALLHYLDDFFGGAPRDSLVQAQQQFQHFKKSVTYLEVDLSLTKFAWPGQQMELLGCDWYTVHQDFAIPDDKRCRYLALIDRVTGRRRDQRGILEKLNGCLMYSSNVHWCGPAFLGELRECMYSVSRPEHWCTITPLLRQDLDVWRWMLMKKNRISFKWYLRRDRRQYTDFEIYTDASGTGLGGYNCDNGEWFQYAIPSRLVGPDFDVNRYEMAAIYVAFMLWGAQATKKCIHIWTDNEPCKWALIKKKSRSPYVRWLLRAVCIHTVIHDYLFYVDYINTKENTVADKLSRMVSPSDIVDFEGNALDLAKERQVGRFWGGDYAEPGMGN